MMNERSPRKIDGASEFLSVKGILHFILSWKLAMGLALACLLAELAILLLGAVGKVSQANRDALEASRIQLAAVREKARLAAQSRSAPPPTIISGVSRARDINSTLKPRDLSQILEEEGEMGESGASSPLPVTVKIATSDEIETQVDQEAAERDSLELNRLVKASRMAMIEGDMRRCILCLEQAATIAPDHPAVLYFFGMSYEKLLNVDKAREHYAKVFSLRERAGAFFKKAALRLKGGFETPAAMRGKMSFGPPQTRHSYNSIDGETVVLTLPVLLAPGQEMRPEDLYISVQFFDLVNGQNIQLTRAESPSTRWLDGEPDWSDGEEILEVTYHMPMLTDEELSAFGEMKYYGYTAKLFFKGEPLDCIGAPSALLLIEQSLQSRTIPGGPEEVLPEDESDYYGTEN